MTDIGFYHPDRGYWQAVEPAISQDDLLATYPSDTVVVPLRPDANHAWQDGLWVYVAPPAAPAPVPVEISDVQFAQHARDLGMITQDEALAFVRTGALPASLAAAIATLPAADQANALLQVSGAKTFRRDNPITIGVGVYFAAQAASSDASAWTDDFFRAAGAL